MGQALPGDRPDLATGLGARRPVLRVCPRHPQDDVHHQRRRGAHRSLRKIIKTRGSFPNDDAALKLLYLAIKNAGMKWRRPVEWTAAMGQFAIAFGPRFPGSVR
jgi:putative transposase